MVEIFPDLCYSITGVGQTKGFRLIMVKPTIVELAALKESILTVRPLRAEACPGTGYSIKIINAAQCYGKGCYSPITELIGEYRP